MSYASSVAILNNRRTKLWFFSLSALIVTMIALQYLPAASISMTHPTLMGMSPLQFLAIFMAAHLCEYMDSSLGMGYGTTLTPLLLLAGFAPLDIVPAILLSELLTGITAVAWHHYDGNVDLFKDTHARRTAILLSVLSGAGAILAVWTAVTISKFWLGIIITAIILGMGVVILATRKRKIRFQPQGIIAIGAIAAFNKGLSGGGYGPLVTAGQVVSGLPAKHAVAITSLAESWTCFVGLMMYLALGKNIAWELAIPLGLGAIMSVPMATFTVSRTSDATMRSVVGIVTLLLGIVALVKTL